MLILAGIAINMLTGSNSVLNKATESREKNFEGQVRDEIAIAWNAVQTKGIPKKWTLEQKKDELLVELKKEDSEATIADLEDGKTTIKITSYKGYEAEIDAEEGTIVYIRKIGEYNGGGNSGGNSEITTPTLAEDVLKVNPDGRTDAEKSPYVRYNGQLYRVLYDSNSSYGIELISAGTIGNVTLGKDDTAELVNTPAGQNYVRDNGITLTGMPEVSGTLDRAKWSYNNCIATLNYAAEKCRAVDDNIIDDARCVGSMPNNKFHKNTELMTGTKHLNGFENPEGVETYYGERGTPNHSSDVAQMETLHLSTVGDYWLGSRFKFFGNTGTERIGCDYYSGHNGETDMYVARIGIVDYAYDGSCRLKESESGPRSATHPIRPVLHVKNGVMVNNGNGTSGSPYTLTLGTN